LSLLDSGWIQSYALDAQEALDLTLQAFAVAEHPEVLTPVMVNLDGFVLTHTYEAVDVPPTELADEFLPPFVTANRMDLDRPKSLGFVAGAADNTEFKYLQHVGVLNAAGVIADAEAKFNRIFGRKGGGLAEAYLCDDAEYILITLGSVAGTVRSVVDDLRAAGRRVGLLRLRYLRPFPGKEIAASIGRAKAVGVLEKDISFGHEGAVYTNVLSALARGGNAPPSLNFVAGLGGRDISRADIKGMFDILSDEESPRRFDSPVRFIGLRGAKAGLA
jgi:pyruvate ferredoxin oxidoreductase alpha subunit